MTWVSAKQEIPVEPIRKYAKGIISLIFNIFMIALVHSSFNYLIYQRTTLYSYVDHLL